MNLLEAKLYGYSAKHRECARALLAGELGLILSMVSLDRQCSLTELHHSSRAVSKSFVPNNRGLVNLLLNAFVPYNNLQRC